MQEFDYFVPQFFTRVRGTCIVVTPGLISEVLHVPRVAHPDYPGCDHLKTVSKSKLMSRFYGTSFSWGGLPKTPLARPLLKV